MLMAEERAQKLGEQYLVLVFIALQFLILLKATQVLSSSMVESTY